MNLAMYATLFKLAPIGKRSIIEALRKNSNDLKTSSNKKDWDEATVALVAAGFFSMSIGDWKVAEQISLELMQWHQHYTDHQGTQAQKMRAHGNALLLKAASTIFKESIAELTPQYDELQRTLSQSVVESAFYGKRWKNAQVKAAQMQLYLAWLVLGAEHRQTWQTVNSLVNSIEKEEAFNTLTEEWFEHTNSKWSAFVTEVRTVVQRGPEHVQEKIQQLK